MLSLLERVLLSASPAPESTSTSAAHSRGPTGLVTHGRTRTKYYKDKPDTVKERNSVRRRMEEIAGGRRAVAALIPEARALLRQQVTGKAPKPQPKPERLPSVYNPPVFEEGSKHGYVYVMTNLAWPQYVKVGSANDLHKRLAQFNTGSPWRDYEIRHWVYVDDRRAAEARVHEMLKEFRAGGEWFNTWLTEAVECLDEVAGFDPRTFHG